MLYEEMRLRPNGEIVRVYSIDASTGNARIWCASQFMKSDQGWQTVKSNKLVPVDFPLHSELHLSNTKKNNAKKRLKLVDAVWETTDGLTWSHEHLEDAVVHEAELMKKESEELDAD